LVSQVLALLVDEIWKKYKLNKETEYRPQ